MINASHRSHESHRERIVPLAFTIQAVSTSVSKCAL